MEKFEVGSGLDAVEHEKGNPNCSKCWTDFPKKCKCGGLIHAEFGDESYDGDYWLYYKCDECGSTDEPEEDV